MLFLTRITDCCGAGLAWILRRLFPCLHRFLTSKPEEYKVLKSILGFPFGAALAIGLYYAVIDRMKFSEAVRYSFGGLIGLTLSIGFALSTQVRCVSLLVIPTFFGKSGRSYVGTFAIAFLITGPITNIMYNGGEVARSISCSAQLMANLTRARLELRLKPIHDVMLDLQNQGDQMQNMTAHVKDAFDPIKREVVDETELKTYRANTDYVDDLEEDSSHRSSGIEKRHKDKGQQSDGSKATEKYEKKIDYRCEDIFNIGVLKCRKVFAETEAKCMEKMSIAGHLLCLPLKLTVLCQLVRNMPSMTGLQCNSANAVNKGFSGSFQTAEEAADTFQNNFKVNMQYKLESTPEELDKKTSEDVAKAIKHEFDVRQRLFDFFMVALQRLLAFLFIRVFISAFSYHKKYISDFDHDNIYRTGYFRKIDARRKTKGKRTLIPLKKAEKKTLIMPTKPTLTGPERSKLAKGTVKLLGRLFTYGVIIFVDHFIFEVLDIIQRHSRVDFKQKGEHHIDLIIYGKGIVGHIVRTLLRGFSKRHSINQVTTNFECLPRPHKMPTEYIWKILTVFGVIWALMITEAFGLRLRRCIASFFYPKREKKRVLYLYNDMLKKRKGYLKHTRGRVRELAREQKLSVKTGLLASLRQDLPFLCCCLAVFKSSRQKCLICEEGETKALKFHKCKQSGCNMAYCGECWIDIKKRCYACSDPTLLKSDSDTDN